MHKEEARALAQAVRDTLPHRMRTRLKAIHVAPRLHSGHLTLRVFMTTVTADDPPEYIFACEELR